MENNQQIIELLKKLVNSNNEINTHLKDIKSVIWFVEDKKVLWELVVDKWPANAIEVMALELARKQEMQNPFYWTELN